MVGIHWRSFFVFTQLQKLCCLVYVLLCKRFSMLHRKKGLVVFVTHRNYSEQFFLFSERFSLKNWLYMFLKFHIMFMMLWRIPKCYKDSPSYLSMRLRNSIWIIYLIPLVLFQVCLAIIWNLHSLDPSSPQWCIMRNILLQSTNVLIRITNKIIPHYFFCHKFYER